MSAPLAVIGLPMYGEAPHAKQALTSLLTQTCDRLALVITDDGGASRDSLSDLLADPRVTYLPNSCRLGLTGNWRRAYGLATTLHPAATYFAWGSDHDVWHPEWLERLSTALSAEPRAVLAYGSRAVLSDQGAIRVRSWHFDTVGAEDPSVRLRQTIHRMAAGYMIYGLFRKDVPDACGGFRPVLMPDRLLLCEASVLGTFVQVDSALWYRRKDTYSPQRQRSALFPQAPPTSVRVAWWISHPAFFVAAMLRSEHPVRRRLALSARYALSTARLLGRTRLRAVTPLRRHIARASARRPSR